MSSVQVSYSSEDIQRAKLFHELMGGFENENPLFFVVRESDVFSDTHRGYLIKMPKENFKKVSTAFQAILNKNKYEICSLDINSSMNDEFPKFNLIVQNEKIINVLNLKLKQIERDSSSTAPSSFVIQKNAKEIGEDISTLKVTPNSARYITTAA